MTIIRTYRPVSCSGRGDFHDFHGRSATGGCTAGHSERVFRDPVLAGAWAEFMALAGYVVEMEGDRA